MAAITDYNSLIAAITSYVDGAQFDPAVMIQMAEADFRRNINSTASLATTAINVNAPVLPNDFDSLRSLSIAASYAAPLATAQEITAVSLGQFNGLDENVTGQPEVYCLTGTTLQLWPTPNATYPVQMVYLRNLPPLSAVNSTNWLLAQHPDAYLFGSVLQAEFFGWNDDRLPLLQQKLSAVIDDINADEQRKRYGSGPLMMRAETTDNVFGPIGSGRYYGWR